uniref:Uncharacterized protein n=1 Tax=Tanacetum cinerariifolium TaxID=118510 RepID=A0A6L2KUB3_TANCI|nr:hypothetical protein [Tanacetum cinerariifolium]
MSANDKFGLGYGDYRNDSILSYENEVLQSVFMNKTSDLEDTLVNDRFANGMHAVPPPMTGNYMPYGPDVETDYSKFTYGQKQTSADESNSKPSEYASCESDSSVETFTSMPEPVENASKVICKPKVWTDASIIEEYKSNSDNDSVSNVQEDKEKPSFAFIDSVKHVKTSRENIKETGTTNHSPKIEKHDRNGHTRKGLGYAFTRKACFVCGSFSHLIRDCDFHEKRMAKQAELTNSKNKVTDQRENRPVWNNVQYKEMASLKQMTLGKDISNPLMAGRLPKTTFPTRLVKTINDEVMIQALIDEKRVNIKEFSSRRTLKLDDAEGTSCLANAEIFDGLAKMGCEKLSKKLTFYKAFFSPQWKFLIHTILQCLSAKKTSWNEFSSTMASLIICLAKNQKFNFSRYILLSLVKNIEAGVSFFMFPRFVQLLIDHQLGDMSHHKDIYDNPSFTKKVFANMTREVGLIQDNVQLISIPMEPSTSKPHKKHKPKKQQTQAPKVPSPEPSPEHRLPLPSNDPLPGGKDNLKLKELMDLCTHLSNKVLELESEIIDIKSTYKESIKKLEGRVDRLEEENKVLKELYSVHYKVDTVAPVVEKEKSFKQGRIIADIDEDVEINLEEAQAKPYRMDLEHPEKVLNMQDVDDEEPVEVEEVLEVVTAAKLITKVVTTARATTTAEATKVSVSRRRKGVVIQDPEETTSTDVVHSEVQSKDKGKEKVNEEVIVPVKEVEVEGHKREGESLKKEITKKQKMDEEAEELKSHLQIVSNDDDDVYTEATPLASKIPIVDYKIYLERNKPYLKIIRADASVWRDQKGRYVLAKRYHLTHFTLEQMLNNVRLEVEKESEMYLE